MAFKTSAILTLSLLSATVAVFSASAMRTEKNAMGEIDTRAQRHGSPARHAARPADAPTVQGSQSGLIKTFNALADGEKSRGLLDELRRKIEKNNAENGAALRAFKNADFETYQREVVAAYKQLGSKVARQIAAELLEKHPNSLKGAKKSAAHAAPLPMVVAPMSRPVNTLPAQPRRAASPLPQTSSPTLDLRRSVAQTRAEEMAPRSATTRDVMELIWKDHLPVDPLLDLLQDAQPAHQMPAFWTAAAYNGSVVYSKPVTEKDRSYTLYALMPGENKIIDLLPLQGGVAMGGQMVLQSAVGLQTPKPQFMELFLLQNGRPPMLTFAQGVSFEGRLTNAGTSSAASAGLMMSFGEEVHNTAEALRSQMWMHIPLTRTPARMQPSDNFSATPYRDAREARRVLIEQRKAARALKDK